MNETGISADVALTISAHDRAVAANESAAKMVTAGRLAEPTQKAIEQAFETNLSWYVAENGLTSPDRPLTTNMTGIDTEQFEFGLSTAVDSKTGDRHTTRPLKGHQPRIAPSGIPTGIINNQCSAGLPADIPSRESSHRSCYADFTSIHTHLFHPGDVGLSAGDLKDNIPGPDHLGSQQMPYEIYRAKGAVVFTDAEEHLPTNQPVTEAETADHYLFDEPLPVRPWLHLVERTDEATNLSKTESTNLHYETLNPLSGSTEAERYQELRSRLEPYLAELIIPLAPSGSA